MNTQALLAGVALTVLCGVGSTALAARTVERDAVIAAATPDAQVDFEVFLPLRDQAGLEALVTAQHTPGSSLFHAWLTPAQFAERFGPTAASMARAQAAIRAAGLQVTEVGARSFHVSGDAAHAGRLIGASLALVSSLSGGTRFIATRDPVLPDALLREGARIAAFTGIPARRPNSAITGQASPENRYGTVGTYWFTDLKQAYDYPSFQSPGAPYPVANGAGVKVAVLMSDLIYSSDVTALFNAEKYAAITKRASPTVTTVKVDGGGVQGGPGSFEASLDVQQVLGGAPGATVTLVSIPDLSDQHIMDGYNYIVKRNTFDIVNSSFGGCELEYTAPYNGGVDYTYILGLYDQIFLQGNSQGITFVASSGDQGGVLCPSPNYGVAGASPTFIAGVSTPADDPRVTAVGGGNLVTTFTNGSLNAAYVRESAYGDPDAPYDIYSIGQKVSGGYWGAGGGVSAVFAAPTYQSLVNTGSKAFRTIPDVGMQVGGLGFSKAGCASPARSCGADDSSVVTAYKVGKGGGYYDTIGTSVASPEFVGALALYEQTNRRQGNVNAYLYAQGLAQTLAGGASAPASKQYYHRSMPGFDGSWAGGYPSANYDYIYGNGSPDVRKLFGLTTYAPAGAPQTASNP